MDKLKLFPDQLADQDFTECAAISVCDLSANILGIPFNSDFTYAATLSLEGVLPNTDGSDPWTAMQSAVAYGLLPESDATFTSKTVGELYCANFANYTPKERTLALTHQLPSLKNIGVDFDAMVTHMKTTGQGVLISLSWFSSFSAAGFGNIITKNPDGSFTTAAGGTPTGVLPAPSGGMTNHAVAAYLSESGEILIKPWLGPAWGMGGYAILTRTMFYTIVKNVFAFDMKGNHWFAILSILFTKFPYLKNYASKLAFNGGDPDFLYSDWSIISNAHHNVRALCDLEGLTWVQKQTLTACVMVESGFNIHAVNHNLAHHPDGTRYVASTDNGICQWNDFYHGKEITPDEALHNPEKAVRLMCKYWKQGLQKQWVSYSAGLYLKYLDRV